MRWLVTCALAVSVFSIVAGVPAARAVAPVAVTMGTTWDGPGHALQDIVDAYIGVPGAVNVHTDYVGAHVGDNDPFYWIDSQFPVMLVTTIAANSNRNVLGWYHETGVKPVLDGVSSGIIFPGGQPNGAANAIVFPSGTQKFGFYLDTQVSVWTTTGKQDQIFYTNRFLNDIGPYGNGAVHAPYDGDVQALVFDVSRWKGAHTWLVCFEDTDSGLPVTSCCSGTDNDYNDLVFEIRANGATPVKPTSFGALKAAYH